ncbi:methylenetetrahydrofolate reductase 5-10 [Sporomusaceae bacterium BoRhaA]|uniref:methylenetetrahydrofolate reductase n=1 Tax=Pelorhabdus rhamnosifermentans TaxID=2772457 RepID=UPI001C061C76|nr:methylenetetrahydrofolate reductase [Pelorhabdus rhamnosifermentans]MBU2703143.1 methylenetetrahydrofolate reductase 5-10 [Pelorhabdus rhamnosifermentans]
MTLREKLQRGVFTITVELDPPKSSEASKTLQEATRLHGSVDAINIADSPMANMRMSPIALSHIIQIKVGIETIFHLTCRDRNIIGLQSELLGAAALGVTNILTLTGDDPKRGDHPDATGVFETDSTGLIQLANTLNQGLDKTGHSLDSPTHFFIGTAVNPDAKNPKLELEKLKAKIAAGARFTQTQPIYDIAVAERFMSEVSDLPIYVLMGILPLKSYKMAQYLHEKVPGINIPAAIMEEMKQGGKEAGIAIARRTIEKLKHISHGIHIMPLNNIDTVLALTKKDDTTSSL